MNLLLLTLAAQAEQPVVDPAARAPGPSWLHTTGELRLDLELPPDFVVNTDGEEVGQGPHLDSRARLGLQLQGGVFLANLEGDLLSGQLAGDPWDLGPEDERGRGEVDVFDLDSQVPRRASLQANLKPLQIEAGLVTSQWGLGMVANDGAHDPYFGRTEFGDRVLRLRLSTAPFKAKGERLPLYLTVAGDRVVADDTARWSEDQSVYQGVGSVLYAPKSGARYGVYEVYRHQTEADDERKTTVWVTDLWAEQPIPLAGGQALRFGLEAAGIAGDTSRSVTYNARESLKVRSAGLTALASWGTREDRLVTTLRGGWASGDGDPDDDTLHDFAFDRDFDAGMVLFDELMGAVEQGAYNQLTDGEHAAVPPDGVDAVVTEGAVRRASFLQPIVSGKPLPWVKLQGGVMLAWASAPISQPFATYRNGGAPANHLGEPTEGYALGTELDWSVTVGDTVLHSGWVKPKPALVLQGGHLFPSEALAGAEAGVMSRVSVLGRLRW